MASWVEVTGFTCNKCGSSLISEYQPWSVVFEGSFKRYMCRGCGTANIFRPTHPYNDVSPVGNSPILPTFSSSQEDKKMRFAVLQIDLGKVGSAATIVKHTVTADEAKQYAETLVAGLRSNISVKQFFAVTVVDTFAGKLVGAIVDAPPTVDWGTGS